MGLLLDIRFAEKRDLNLIQEVIRAAFSDEERELISTVAATLSLDTIKPPVKSLVAEDAGQVIGYVSYSPLLFEPSVTTTGYILAPLAVSPACQRQGVGSKLIEIGIEMLSKSGVDVLLVYGDPEYYKRFGFKEEIGRSFVPPYRLKYPFGWLGVMLREVDISKMLLRFECVSALNKPELW